MDATDLTIDSQLQSASELSAECERYRDQFKAIRDHVADLARRRQRQRTDIERQATKELQAKLGRIDETADQELATLRLDSNARRQSLKASCEQALQNLSNRASDEVAECEEKRKSELWVLQSVLDEDLDDTPATTFDREAETFHTQKTFLDERLMVLHQQLEETGAFLQSCHAGMDQERPESTIKSGKRLEMRDAAVAASDAALAVAGDFQGLHLPQWVKGGRLWAFCIIGFLIVWVAVTAARENLRNYINPDLGHPDWEWAAVAALISIAAVVAIAFIVVYQVQSTLRQRFSAMLQHVSNAESARSAWERKTEKYIDQLEAAAEEWRTTMELRRVEQARKITSEIDARIAAVHARTTRESTDLQEDLTRQLNTLAASLITEETRINSRRLAEIDSAQQSHNLQLEEKTAAADRQFAETTNELRSQSQSLLARWSRATNTLRQICQTATTAAAATVTWPQLTDSWKLPENMPECISAGEISVTVPLPPEPDDASAATSLCIEMPAILHFPKDTSIVVEHDSAGRNAALSFIRTQILKLLTVIPAGRIRLTLIDPVGLGQSFSAMMHLTDFDELLIHSRIWTDSSQIRDQLQKITEHMENIFQTYLRSQFETIEEYNASAGEVAEPYHFVVVAGFPTAFTDEACRHLSSILTSGARCGVHALVAWNPTMAVPPGFDTDDLVNNCQRFRVERDSVVPHQKIRSSVQFTAVSEPASENYVQLVRLAGEQSKDARRVEVSFNRIAPRVEDIWSKSTADGIDLPIGRAGAARLQFMRLGRGTSQHVLIAGKTGSGKSTFLHILITNLALHYSPREIQFYLIDFKKGVEFRTYAANKLPHARVVAIESDREFGLSVLERLDEILQERGELFRERGIQDVPAFRQQFPDEPMPRLMLLIDEFQEFFVAEDRVSARASLLLDRLVRQGRAFGIHVLLGSQTLGGAYSLARSTMGQIAVRIALQCSESDAHLILSEDNSAARLLTRPGEAIYNDANGLVQGNHQFQIAWLEESRREEAIGTMIAQNRPTASVDSGMIVFEGNVPPLASHCGPMNAALTAKIDATQRSIDGITCWLGEPVAIAAPTAIEFRRGSGQNLLIVGQDENQTDSLLAHVALSALLPHRDPVCRVNMLVSERDHEAVQRFVNLHQAASLVGFGLRETSDCAQFVATLINEIERREAAGPGENDPPSVFIVRNIGQFRELRREEDDFGLGGFGEAKPASTASQFGDIVKRGPLVGVHVVVWSDTFSNAVRWLSSSMLREFETRVAFRMNQTDSASLVDSPVASSLGPGRALVYRDQTGTTEKFRPFAWPAAAWLHSLTDTGASSENDDLDIDSLTIE